MRIETILNHCQKFKSFVYKKASWGKYEGTSCLLIEVVPRKNSQACCSVCHKRASLYDRLSSRQFEFVPLWGYRTFFVYQMRRVDCQRCGIKVEQVPWASGKQTLTQTYMRFLSDWASCLSWSETAKRFHSSWSKVYESVKYAVNYGLSQRDLSDVTAIGVDEISIRKGHHYLTMVYQIDKDHTRLLWLGQGRSEQTLTEFFELFGTQWASNIRYICSDMWKPYLKVIRTKLPQALHILDRFHIVANLNKALDKVRAEEARRLQSQGHEPVLKKSRWCLLKSPSRLTDKQGIKLNELLRYNLTTVKAYLLKESFQLFWNYTSPYWAERFLKNWCDEVEQSNIAPVKKEAQSLRRHRELILNWFRAKKAFSSGIVEGLNNKAKVVTKKAYGFKHYKYAEIALYHQLGKLPRPPDTHRF